MPDFSIIICTYNPTPSIFKRVLDAVARLIIPAGYTVECCIVDNNSKPALNQLDYVNSFLESTPWARLVTEPTQGKPASLVTAVRETAAPYIVLFDDDNQPEPDYLLKLANLVAKYPQVGVWGPGRVRVEFTEEVNPWVRNHKYLFQEKSAEATTFGQEPYWTSHHPAGTGQVTRREIMQLYVDMLKSKAVSITGRTGNSLSSGEDAQVVYIGIKLGYHVGVSPDLTLYHLIPSKRTSIEYLKRLQYQIMSSGAIANVEIFPEQKSRYYTNIRSPFDVLFNLLKIVGISIRDRSSTQLYMQSGTYLGKLAGSYVVTSGKVPLWLTLSARVLRLS